MENRTNKRMQWVIRLGCILGLMTALCGCSSTEVVKVAKYAAKEVLKTTAPQKDRSEGESSSAKDADGKGSDSATQSLDNLKDHAAYNGEPYVELNDNVPNFTTVKKTTPKHLRIIIVWMHWDVVAQLMPIYAKSLCRRRNVVRSVW